MKRRNESVHLCGIIYERNQGSENMYILSVVVVVICAFEIIYVLCVCV